MKSPASLLPAFAAGAIQRRRPALVTDPGSKMIVTIAVLLVHIEILTPASTLMLPGVLFSSAPFLLCFRPLGL